LGPLLGREAALLLLLLPVVLLPHELAQLLQK